MKDRSKENQVRVASIALIKPGGGPGSHRVSYAYSSYIKECHEAIKTAHLHLSIFGYADGHPTFLVLLDARTAPWLLDPLNFLLVDDKLARR